MKKIKFVGVIFSASILITAGFSNKIFAVQNSTANSQGIQRMAPPVKAVTTVNTNKPSPPPSPNPQPSPNPPPAQRPLFPATTLTDDGRHPLTYNLVRNAVHIEYSNNGTATLALPVTRGSGKTATNDVMHIPIVTIGRTSRRTPHQLGGNAVTTHHIKIVGRGDSIQLVDVVYDDSTFQNPNNPDGSFKQPFVKELRFRQRNSPDPIIIAEFNQDGTLRSVIDGTHRVRIDNVEIVFHHNSYLAVTPRISNYDPTFHRLRVVVRDSNGRTIFNYRSDLGTPNPIFDLLGINVGSRNRVTVDLTVEDNTNRVLDRQTFVGVKVYPKRN